MDCTGETSVQTAKVAADEFLLQMLKKYKSDQEATGCLVLEVMPAKPLIPPQPTQNLYETRYKKLVHPFQLHLIKSSSLSLGSINLQIHWRGTAFPKGSWDNTTGERDQSSQSELSPILITPAEFNRVFLDCLKKSAALLEKSVPLLGNLPLIGLLLE